MSELTEIINDIQTAIDKLRQHVEPSPDVASDRVEPAPPTPKFATGQRVRVVRDTQTFIGTRVLKGKEGTVSNPYDPPVYPSDTKTCQVDDLGILDTADLEAIPDEPTRPEPPAIDPDHLPERTPIVVAVTKECRGNYHFGGSGYPFRRRSIPIGWELILRDGEPVLRGPRNEIMTAEDVYACHAWSVTE